MSLYGQGTLLIFKVLTENLGVSTFADNNIDIDQFHNSTDKKHYGFNGTTWNALY